MDGGEEGELETECYYARMAKVRFQGRAIHPGSARGKMVNAVTMAGAYISMLPRNESPEATDGRYGNYWPHRVEGGLESAELVVFYRSFDESDIDRRTEALKSFGTAVEASFPGGTVTVETKEQYRNMREELDRHPLVIEKLRQALLASGVEPIERPIRGGTDGARLTAMGIPTPNIFAGGVNFHSRSEWVALPAMTRAVTVILNLVRIWSE
jgi:tripeptide aminopeptidase